MGRLLCSQLKFKKKKTIKNCCVNFQHVRGLVLMYLTLLQKVLLLDGFLGHVLNFIYNSSWITPHIIIDNDPPILR